MKSITPSNNTVGIALLASLVVLASVLPCAAERPNVLLILTDDQGWGDITSHGNQVLDTPVLDRLAASGARFERFYVSPVCAPTRAALLTGRYHLRTGVHGVTRGYETMRSEEVTIAEMLADAGYTTGCFGKWHNGAHYPYHPNGQGFDEFFGFCAGHWNQYFDTELQRNGDSVQTRGYITDVLTDAALEFIDENRNGPFFCYVPYNAPHSPYEVPDQYFDKYKARGVSDKLACIYGMVENIDDNVGRLLERIDELQLAEETVVIFLTDNGPNSDRYNGGMRGRKGSVHEGGVRVPLFIRRPGRIEPGTTVERICAHVDLLPTILDMADVSVPEGVSLDGTSLLPLLEGPSDTWPERMLFTHRIRGRRGDVKPVAGAVRTPRWRAVFGKRGWQLYDMPADPGEKRNVADEHPGLVKQFDKAYRTWFEDVTRNGFDVIPIPVGHAGWPVVELPAHEAFLRPRGSDDIAYVVGPGYAHSWVHAWTSTDAYPQWEVDVVRSGRYAVTLEYACPSEDVGSRIRVHVGGESLEGVVRPAHDPEPHPSPDRAPVGPHKAVKDWAKLDLGTVRLDAGRTQLTVRAAEIPGRQIMELKAVELRRVD